MALAPLFRQLAIALFALAVAMALALLVAFVHDEPAKGPFAIGLFLAAFFGGCLLITSRSVPRRRPARSGFRELVLALSIFWLAAPVFGAMPFLSPSMSFSDAWFEAVSALTTTGGWLSDPGARSTASGMIYRASLQWLGGLVSLGTAAAVFVRPEFVGVQPPTPPFARGKRDSYLRAFSSAINTFAPIYASLSLFSYAAFIIVGVPMIDAVTLALSFVATGGFLPQPGGLEAYGSGAVVVGTLTMAASAINFVVLARLAVPGRGRFKAGPDPETRVFFLMIVPLAVLFWLSIGQAAPSAILQQLVNAVSLLSTSGLLIGDTPALTPLLITAVVGGAAVSTAGGIKLLRWLITFQRAGQELWQLTHPGGVLGSKRPLFFEFGVWIHTIAFTLVLASLVLTVAFFGHDLELAATAAVAAVTNSGPLLAAAPGTTADFFIFEEPLRLLLAVGMIAGRLELVVLLLLFDREFWAG
ncbi:MAG: potassium transporter TrkG [Pseudomonadota bacterium]